MLIVLIVLAMTSVASATGIMILVNGDPYTGQDVKGSDYITVLWLETEQSDGLMFTGGFTWSVDHGDFTGSGYYKSPAFGGFVADPLADGFVFGAGQNTFWTPGSPSLPEDDVVLWYEFHVPYDLEESTYITIDTTGIYGGVNQDEMDIVLHVMPEPMTVALLGLGGLFLVRRRKK